MTHEDILTWLYTLSPIEAALKDYYLHYHRPPQPSMFHQISCTQMPKFDKAFDNIDTIPAITAALDGLPGTLKLEMDDTWIQKDENISICRHPRYSPVNIHTHTFIEISVVYHGQCTHHFYENLHDLTDGEQLDLKTGDICIIPPNTCHSISVFDDSIIINLLIRTKLMKETLSRILSSNHLLFDFFVHTLYNKDTSDFMLFSTDADQRILNLLVDMMLEACERRPYYQQASDLMLGLMFTYLQRDFSDHIRFSRNAATGIGHIPPILQYMHQHYNQNVDEIAGHFHLNTAYLSRLFKKHTHHTAIETLKKIRMEAAKDFLLNSHMPVQDISQTVGYSDIPFFYSTFKKYYGATPLQYRKNARCHVPSDTQ